MKISPNVRRQFARVGFVLVILAILLIVWPMIFDFKSLPSFIIGVGIALVCLDYANRKWHWVKSSKDIEHE